MAKASRSFLTPFLMLCFVGLTARLGYQMARSPVLPQFAADLGAGPEMIGFILAASTMTGVALKLPAGALSDVLGRRRILLLGGAFFAGPPLLYVFVRDPYALLALRFLHGSATAIFSPVASAAVADLFNRGRGERLGWFASANEIGSAIAPLVGGFILTASNRNFSLVYWIVAALGALTFLLVLRLPIGGAEASVASAPGGQRWRTFRRGMGQVVRDRSILIASGAEAALFLGVGALVGFLPLYGAQHIGLSDVQVGLVLGVQLIAAMAGKPLTGKLSDRVGRKPLILVGLVLCATVLPLVPLTRSLPLLLLESTLFGLGMAVVTPATTALVTDLSRAGGYGAALGVFGTIWDVGEALGPILAGALIVAFAGRGNAYVPAFLVIAGILLLFALAFGRFVSIQKPMPPAPSA
ncbi:MAG: transporter [Dehalococcoidia bacterium]|nr:transporter [Dehalococcoidia bacterium]